MDLDGPEGVVAVGGGRVVAPDHRVLARDLATGGEVILTHPGCFTRILTMEIRRVARAHEHGFTTAESRVTSTICVNDVRQSTLPT